MKTKISLLIILFCLFSINIASADGWASDSSLASGLGEPGDDPAPEVFYMDGDCPTPIPTPIPTSTYRPTITPIIAIPPTEFPTPEPIPLEILLPEQLEDTIFEEIISYLSKAFSWLFILAAYIGAFIASIILMRENEDFDDIKYSILFFGTLGWIIPLLINSINLIQLVTQSFLLNAIIFAGFGFMIYAILNMFGGKE